MQSDRCGPLDDRRGRVGQYRAEAPRTKYRTLALTLEADAQVRPAWPGRRLRHFSWHSLPDTHPKGPVRLGPRLLYLCSRQSCHGGIARRGALHIRRRPPQSRDGDTPGRAIGVGRRATGSVDCVPMPQSSASARGRWCWPLPSAPAGVDFPLLAVFSIVYVTAGVLAFGPLLEEA